jgi:hypothetical protein
MSDQKLIPGMSYRVKKMKSSDWEIAEFVSTTKRESVFYFPGYDFCVETDVISKIDYTPIDPNPDSEKKRLAEMLIAFAKTDPVNITPYTIEEYANEFLDRYFEK